MSGSAIEVHDLRMQYGAVEAVRGIDLEVATGEVFGFLGPNGAGKTTTIEILEGYRPRTAGEVSVLGVDPARATRAWRDRLGLVLQSCELDPLLTVRETLSLFAGFYTKARPVDEIVELVGLADKRDVRIGRLSGGQRRRADVGVALVGDPELVFLDEPTTGFDPAARREAWSMIEGLKALGKTVFLTTHYMDEAQHLADRVAILRAGKIVAIGAPDELGEGLRAETIVTFRALAPSDLETLRARVEPAAQVVGETTTLRTADAQVTLGRLLAWADERGVVLEHLEVRRPDLEDIFLELVGDDPAKDDPADGAMRA
ncbi:MAG: ABC transporter ATP-binding protein [Acidimicrobiia bacterium]